eukprot:5242594-Pleurochrysis_carterae.AAC.1
MQLGRRQLLARLRPRDGEAAPAKAQHAAADLLFQGGRLRRLALELRDLAVGMRRRLPACRRLPLLEVVKSVDVRLAELLD